MEAKTKAKSGTGNAGRCTKARSKARYARKRRFHGKIKSRNATIEQEQPVKQTTTMSPPTSNATTVTNRSDTTNKSPSTTAKSGTSSKTISDAKVIDLLSDKVVDDTEISGYRLVDASILSLIFKSLCCPDCKNGDCLQLYDLASKKKGLARCLELKCSCCSYTRTFYTSKELTRKDGGKGRNKYEINVRAVYACRQIGSGHEHLKKLCCYLDMPELLTSDNYDSISKTIQASAKVVAEKSMSDAAEELKNLNGDGKNTDVGVSVDGTWQRKGFTSMNGVITAISVDNGKVLDVSILSKSCKGCVMANVLKSDPKRYEEWKATHKCSLNYTGSSPNMEKVGAENIFKRSVKKRGLYYTSFYGDGDSKSFPAVENVYEPKRKVAKKECIGHYQKRVGTRLRKLKKNTKGLGGKKRLTDAKIDTLQNYFGIALRQNIGNLDAMVKGCMASMYHVAGHHESCPKSSESWCQFQKDKFLGTKEYKSKGELPLDIRMAILPIYKDLCKKENLSKCLHGKTQNANESFNGMIWNRIPKANHVALNTLALGVYDAIAHFNIGAKASLDIFHEMNLEAGVFMSKGLHGMNVSRKRMSAYRMSSPQKKRRKVIRHLRKKGQDKDIEKEGTTYEAGGF